MNLDERAELAFEHHIDNYGIDWGSNCELFSAGYRAAMRSLYVEVKPEARRHREVYDCELRDGQWVRLMHFAAGYAYWDCHRENRVAYDYVLRTVRLDVIPSPAEIFGNQTH